MCKPVGHTTDFMKAQETDLHKLAARFAFIFYLAIHFDLFDLTGLPFHSSLLRGTLELSMVWRFGLMSPSVDLSELCLLKYLIPVILFFLAGKGHKGSRLYTTPRL